MPYRKQKFTNNEIYHIVLRGIDDNLIFKNTNDYYRGIFSIYEFNNANPVEIFKRRREIRAIKEKLKKIGGGPASTNFDKRDKLVEILAFCFMPNHIHLLLKQLKEGGITKFMGKVGTGYGGYFNRKYKRKGYVFQNRFLAIRIKSDKQLATIFIYIHANPISLIEPKWKEIGIKNPEQVIEFLESYKWSSYLDYIGIKNFSSVTERELFWNTLNKELGCREIVENWVRYKGEIKEFSELSLEN